MEIETTRMQSARKGEYLAARWLSRQGYSIEALNWRKKHYEIDIIASSKDYFVFVEVKLRSDSSFGFPENKVNKQKQSFLKLGASEFMRNNNNINKIRFDIVSIVESAHGVQMVHFKDAFFPLKSSNTNRVPWYFLKG